MQALKYSDICLVPNYSEVHSRVDCDPSVDLFGKKFLLPIIPANMKSVIDMHTCEWMSSHGFFYIMHRFDRDLAEDVANAQDWDNISFSVGVKASDKMAIQKIKKRGHRVDYLTIDIAHGYSARMKTMISWIKKHLPNAKIIAGNVATSCAVRELANWGADIVKVGIGQGSPCTTKDKTGFTMPMFTCVKLCSNVNVPIIADGGIRCRSHRDDHTQGRSIWRGEQSRSQSGHLRHVLDRASFTDNDQGHTHDDGRTGSDRHSPVDVLRHRADDRSSAR